ncbi:MAG: sulfatase-like hydrolase/transferase [Armatimonadetes bacterium]|nr:sulfatase-like hydrolase/transferase [Armatimonadota bacterium]
MPSRRPNLLIFMTDQEQAHVTFPEHPCRTPHADRLAAGGLRFRRCYTPAAHCCPARACFHTGLYPSGHGIFNNVTTFTAIHTDLNPGVTCFGSPLREEGYRLLHSGKWHVSRELAPSDFGWEELIPAGTRGFIDRSWEMWRRRAAEPERRERERGELYRPGWGMYRHYGTLDHGQGHYCTPHDYRAVNTGLQGLREAARGRDPWCVYLGTLGPHDPYIIPARYAAMYDPAQVSLPSSWRDDLSDRPVVYQRQRRFWDQLTEDEAREAVAHYWGYCTMQDDLLGLALDELDELGQADDTLVLYLSDHGDYNGAHGLWMKGVPAFDEAYRVPLLARWPQGIRNPGREVDDFVTLADFAPTFYELAGVRDAPACHGRSLAPFFRDERPDDWPDTFYTQFNGVELYYTQRVVQTREWKYVFNGFDWDELYDLRSDPHEMHNLAAQPAYAPVIEELCGRLWRFSERTGDFNANGYGTVALMPYGPMSGLRG